MTVRARKVVFVVHMDDVDDEGNVGLELSTQEPLTLYAHQLGELSSRVAEVVERADQQVREG